MSNSHRNSNGTLPVRKASNATERKGIAFVRNAVEDANCVFKEIDRASDYGHDAFILLVDGEQVMPQEFAVQVKAGASYCQHSECSFHATKAQLNFWAQHPLETLGVVYDPDARCAWWVDLKQEAKASRRSDSGLTVRFAKADWNRFDTNSFQTIILPMMLAEPPRIDLETATEWLQSEVWNTHDMGARTLISRHEHKVAAWIALLGAFKARGRTASFSVYRALARIMNHPEEGRLPSSISEADAVVLRQQVLSFAEPEFIELLHFVDDNGFERGGAGYGLFGILPNIAHHLAILRRICENMEVAEEARESAALLLAIQSNDPEWWELWKRPKS